MGQGVDTVKISQDMDIYIYMDCVDDRLFSLV